jgi:hypothetical protein
MKKTILTAFVLIIFSSGVANARPPKGFHEGPYLLFSGGMLTYTADDNVRTKTSTGNDIEPTFGFNFGWNLKDYVGAELQARYSTNRNAGVREHIATANISAVFTLVTPQLTNFKKPVYVLPFVQAGPAVQFAAVPADPAAGGGTLLHWGIGPSIGGGVRVLFARYFYVGVLAQVDFLYLNEKKQDIGGVQTVILNEGWDGQIGISGLAGCHF